MRIQKYLIPAIISLMALGLVFQIFNNPLQAKAGSSGSSYETIDAYVEEQMQSLNIPGVSLVIVEDGQLTHQRGFGQARPGGENPTPQTPFFIGSLTKSITALAIMQLVEGGKVELDAPVQRYLPWFRVADPSASAQMTVRHLLNQTSGLPTSAGEIQMADFDDSPQAAEKQARALSNLVLTRPVGSAFEYSNANYNLLGLVIEATSGETYAGYIREHIFTPLDMDHSYTSRAAAQQNGLAMGHRYWFTIPFAAPDTPVPEGSLPAGQIISCSEDMGHYMIALLNGGRYGEEQILSQAGIAEMQQGVADDIVMGISVGRYGMGWFVDESGSSKLVWHSGTTPDFGAFIALFPEQKKGLVMFFNANHHWFTPVLAGFGSEAAALLAGEQLEPIEFVAIIPWMLRALLLIPLIQIIDVVVTLRFLRKWSLEPGRRPSGWRFWIGTVLLPLVPSLLIACTLIPMLGETRGYMMLYMPDYSWIAILCGSFAVIWIFMRTWQVLRKTQN